MNKEIWKDIPEYEGLYQASNLGNIRSIDRIIKQKHYSGCNSKHLYEGKIISQSKKRYATVTLWKNNKSKRFTVHKLIANTFLDFHNFKYTDYDLDKVFKKDDLIINHKDCNKLNNNVNNLEFCTYSYNNRYGENTNGLNKKVYQYDINNNLIKEYKSISECARINKISNKTLNRHCHLEDIYKNYIWRLKKEVVCYE